VRILRDLFGGRAGTIGQTKRVWLALGIAASVSGMLGCAGPKPKPPVLLAQEEWSYQDIPGKQLRTEHWMIYTTCREDFWTESLPAFLEACYDYYKGLVPVPADSARLMKLYLLDNRLEWEVFTRKFVGKRAGLYLKIRHGGYTRRDTSVVYRTSRGATLSVISHEGMHQYLWQHGAIRIPAWIGEGLATLCEGFRQEGDKFIFAPGANPFRFGDLRRAIRNDALIELPRLLTISAGDVIAKADSSSSVYYAELWAMMRFLREARPYRAGFRKLCAELCSEQFPVKIRGYIAAHERPIPPGEAAFRLYITDDLQTFWVRFREYAARLAGLTK